MRDNGRTLLLHMQGSKEYRTYVKLQHLTPYFHSVPDSAIILTILSQVFDAPQWMTSSNCCKLGHIHIDLDLFHP